MYPQSAAAEEITLFHENEKAIYGDTAKRCLHLFETFPLLRGVFDSENFIQCGEDTFCAWETLKDYVGYMHVKDVRKADGAVIPAGYGDGNLREISKDFIARGGRNFTIEPHLSEFKGLQDLERAGDKTVALTSALRGDETFDIACDAFKKIINR